MDPDRHLIGYSDRIAAGPGESVRFMVSAPEPYRAELLELLHGDPDPEGPGLVEEERPADFAGAFPGRVQPIRSGSYGIARDSAQAPTPAALSFAVWHLPTLRTPAAQGLITRWASAGGTGRGYGLFVLPEGDVAVRVGDGEGPELVVRTQRPLELRTWYRLSGSIDFRTGRMEVRQEPVGSAPTLEKPAAASGEAAAGGGVDAASIPYVVAAHWSAEERPGGHLNGKLERPEVLAGGDVVARWRFDEQMSSVHVPDAGPNGWELELVNMPTRAVTGHSWSGDEHAWTRATGEYAAVHFHDGDLEDAGWEPDFEWHIPPDQPSGVYAARLTADDGSVDRVPVIVRRRRAQATVAVVLPSFTYLAYADEAIAPEFDVVTECDADRYVTATGMVSQYNHHRDGSGVVHASLLRPLPNLRPDHRYWLTGQPHGLGADLYLLDWLRYEGVEFDLLVDLDVHEGGAQALRPYRVVITGSHPEYVTRAQMRAFGRFVTDGGRLMYLGGNGFTMVTGVHPERPHVTEIRRSTSHAGLWESGPGERYLTSTGELGGRWSERRERTRELLGVETVGMGFAGARPYRRLPDSRDPRAAFVFEGVGDDEPIGDFGLGFGGAAGYEVDGADRPLGTPAHALVLARADAFPSPYVPLSSDPDIRAEMTLFETRGGGSVFSVGSITWTASLSHDGYENNVARITRNVLRHFLG